MGTPDFSTKVLEMLIAEHEVIAVVTQPDRPVGRKRVLTHCQNMPPLLFQSIFL
jgi:methionyl-tRNA formyltransferase